MTKAAAVVFICCACATAQSRQERGNKLRDEMVAALGGERFTAMKNRIENGRAYSFAREELSGLAVATIYTEYEDNPAPGTVGVRERQSFGKEERYGAVLLTPDNAWEITFRGARPLPEERIERWRDSTLNNIFYIVRMRLREPGMIFESAGTDIMDNLPVEGLDITDSENRTVRVWLHRTTRLPVRQVHFRRDSKTKQRTEEITIYSKYRDIGGVQWPYDMQRLRDGERSFQMYAESVQVNQTLEDSVFTLPAKVKILKPAR